MRGIDAIEDYAFMKRRFHVAYFCYLIGLMDPKEKKLFEMILREKGKL